MRASLRPLIAVGMVLVGFAGLAPATASAFGTVSVLGQRAEHERITRLALGCRPGQPQDGSCFAPASLDNIAGTTATFGAVGAPDNIPLRLSGGPFYWHCDDADYLDTPGYPQSRSDATEKLNACRQWARDMLFDGRRSSVPGRTWPTQGAVATASTLLDSKGNVDVSDPGTGVFSPTCTFDGSLGRAKCNVWEPFGYVLHAAEDFYSHSNWADLSNPNQPVSITNPPGLGHRDLPAYWDLRQASAPLPDPRLATGCYPTSACKGRITHDVLNKDTEHINVVTGFVSDPTTPRGKIDDNAQRAVNGAIDEAKRQWAIFRDALVARYGPERGGKMICALTSDSADKSCNDALRARTVFAVVPPAFVQLASVLNGQQCLDDPDTSTRNGTNIQMWECNGTAAQQFRFRSRDVQFTSTGTGRVEVVGKCLDAPAGADGTRIQISDCNGTAAQQVTVTSTSELQMLGKCLTVANGDTSNRAALVLVSCGATNGQVWQFR